MKLIAVNIHVYQSILTGLCSTSVLLVISLLLVCCNIDASDKSPSEEKVDVSRFDELSFDPDYLRASSSQETLLFLKAKFSECGEFGGHSEELQIHSIGLNGFHAKYSRYGLECDPPPPPEPDGTPQPDLREVQIDTTINLEKGALNSIKDYMIDLLGGKIEENFLNHSGNTFIIQNTDSSLYIKVYDNNIENVINYFSLLEDLKLPTPKLDSHTMLRIEEKLKGPHPTLR